MVNAGATNLQYYHFLSLTSPTQGVPRPSGGLGGAGAWLAGEEGVSPTWGVLRC